MKAAQQDNSTFAQKVMLRQTALAQLADPAVILETHGGYGDVFSAVYAHVPEGVVFEKDPFRTLHLAYQRPSWSVYEADCVPALEIGVGNHLAVNLLDVDPYGNAWPPIQAFFASVRPRAGKVVVVVNDGLRMKLRGGGAWDTKVLEDMVLRYGNDLWGSYLEICEELMKETAVAAGYAVSFFDGYYCGHEQKMTHYLSVLEL